MCFRITLLRIYRHMSQLPHEILQTDEALQMHSCYQEWRLANGFFLQPGSNRVELVGLD